MLVYGIVTERDSVNCKCRVKLLDHGDMVSSWLPVVVAKTGNDKFYVLPDVDEQVVCMMDENLDTGVIMGAIYSTVDAVPNGAGDDVSVIAFSDGTVIKYDKTAHELTINGPQNVTINAQNVTVTASNGATVNGNLTVNGTVLATGRVTSNVDFTVGPLNFTLHKHPTAPTGPVSTPIP